MIICMMIYPWAIFANDIHTGYDCILHSITSSVLRSLAAPAPAVTCVPSTIQGMRHFIIVTLGNSKWFYAGYLKRWLQGDVQGNIAASPIWTTSTIMFLRIWNIMEHRVNIASPISLLTVIFRPIIYANNFDLLIVGNVEEVIQQLGITVEKYINC